MLKIHYRVVPAFRLNDKGASVADGWDLLEDEQAIARYPTKRQANNALSQAKDWVRITGRRYQSPRR